MDFSCQGINAAPYRKSPHSDLVKTQRHTPLFLRLSEVAGAQRRQTGFFASSALML
jgi:hypothetical protein